MVTALWLLALAVVVIYLKVRKGSRPPFPPGPPPEPLIGHLRYMPSESPGDKIAELSKIYGDVLHLRIFHRHMIFLNSAEAAFDLMDKRSWNYSDRPDFPIMRLLGWSEVLAFLGYGKKFQKHRRIVQGALGHQKVEQYQHIQFEEAHRLVINLLQNPGDREGMLCRFSTSIVMQVAYGHQILSDDDPYNEMVKENTYANSHCGPSGGTPIDLFPILEHFPSWFPGTFFATRARALSFIAKKLHDYPFSEVQREMAEGRAKPSFLSDHLETLHREHRETNEEFADIKGAAAVMYGAGADTTWSTLSVFILAMTLNPGCQKTAQLEIDKLLNGSRLPEINDRESLPYLDCILQECHRWQSTVPLGIPHRVMEDDIYKGMFIPKGSLVFANTRGISMNASTYHDPHLFKPSRYLSKSQGGEGEPRPVAHFGFGRRICPGRYLADVSLWTAMATILTLCNVKKAIGPDGKEITPAIELSSGLTSHPKPYQSVVELRDQRAEKLAEQIRVGLLSE